MGNPLGGRLFSSNSATEIKATNKLRALYQWCHDAQQSREHNLVNQVLRSQNSSSDRNDASPSSADISVDFDTFITALDPNDPFVRRLFSHIYHNVNTQHLLGRRTSSSYRPHVVLNSELGVIRTARRLNHRSTPLSSVLANGIDVLPFGGSLFDSTGTTADEQHGIQSDESAVLDNDSAGEWSMVMPPSAFLTLRRRPRVDSSSVPRPRISETPDPNPDESAHNLFFGSLFNPLDYQVLSPSDLDASNLRADFSSSSSSSHRNLNFDLPSLNFSSPTDSSTQHGNLAAFASHLRGSQQPTRSTLMRLNTPATLTAPSAPNGASQDSTDRRHRDRPVARQRATRPINAVPTTPEQQLTQRSTSPLNRRSTSPLNRRSSIRRRGRFWPFVGWNSNSDPPSPPSPAGSGGGGNSPGSVAASWNI